MAIITFPSSVLPTVCDWALSSLTETFVSPLNGTVQTVSRPGSRWKATLEFGMLSLQQGRDLMAFLVAMDGMAGRCNLINHDRPGSGANVVVNGSNQSGTTLNIRGAVPGRQFNAGDYLSVNGEFKMLTASATADGSGNAALSIGPMLRASPVDGGVVTFTNPTCLMMINQKDFSMPRISGPRYQNVSIPFVEVFA